jgi:ketosteroid isomerase-like protein
MSGESAAPDLVVLTRRLYEAANAGDLDAMTSFFGPEAVWDQPDEIETFHGKTAVRRFIEDWQGAYEEYAVEVEDILDLGNGVTFAVSTQTGRPAGSSGGVRIRFGAVHTWSEGLIARMITYGNVDEARAVAERLAGSRG